MNYRGLINFAKCVLPAGISFAVFAQQPAPLPAQNRPQKKLQSPAPQTSVPRSLATVPSRPAISHNAGRNQQFESRTQTLRAIGKTN